MRVRQVLASSMLVLLITGCGQNKGEEASRPKADTTAPSASAANQPGQADDNAAKQVALSTLKDWVNAQVAGDFDRYMSFYDPKFKGIRRTSKGDMKELDFAGWKQDRESMVKKKPKIAADDPKVTSWKDKPGLAKGTVEVRFTQRFQTAAYADHGPKVIRMRIEGGKARFVYEDMLSSTKGWSSGSGNTTKTDHSGWKFVRKAIPAHDAKGVDACIYQGGFGFACIDAYVAETDAQKKLFMRWISNAEAALAQHELDNGKMKGAGVAHAEMAMACQESGPCGTTGGKDDGYACLTKAEQALWEGNKAVSDAALKRACECGLKRAVLPVMGGTLACNAPNDYGTRGKILPLARAKAWLQCAQCDATAGPAACASTIDYMKGRGYPQEANYLLKVHVPRCQQP